jgi:hypothetical protein
MHCRVQFLPHSITFNSPFLPRAVDCIRDLVRRLRAVATFQLELSDFLAQLLFFRSPFLSGTFHSGRNLPVQRDSCGLLGLGNKLSRAFEFGKDLISFSSPLGGRIRCALKFIAEFAVLGHKLRANSFHSSGDLTFQRDSRALLALRELTAQVFLLGQQMSAFFLPRRGDRICAWIRRLHPGVCIVVVAISQLAAKLLASGNKLGAFTLPSCDSARFGVLPDLYPS